MSSTSTAQVSTSAATGGSAAGSGRGSVLSPGGPVWLVAEREIRSRLRSKAFLISTGLLLLAVLASIVIGSIASASASPTKVAVVGGAAAVVHTAGGFDEVAAADVAAAEKLVRDGKVDAAVVPAETQTGTTPTVRVIALESAPTDVISRLSIAPEVTLLKKPTQNPLLSYFVAIGFGLVFFMSAMTFGTTIAQSVVEEKQTRVVEILLSTISARILLAGKVIGNSLLAFAQILATAILASVALMLTGQRSLLSSLGPSVIWFVVFFVFGFVLIAALYAAAAALVSRQEDVGAVTSPVMLLVMAPYFLVIFFNDNPTVLAIMSYVPFSAPVGMPMRIFLGTAQWWEPLVSLVILLATTAVVIVFGARVYSNSLLRTGARVPLKEALRG
jgi:ABC-2 type transport system permease protein